MVETVQKTVESHKAPWQFLLHKAKTTDICEDNNALYDRIVLLRMLWPESFDSIPTMPVVAA